MSPDKPWKAEERRIRARLGIEGPRTLHGPDAATERFVHEITRRKDLPDWLLAKLCQAASYCREDQIPVVVLSKPRRGMVPQRLAVLWFSDWANFVAELEEIAP